MQKNVEVCWKERVQIDKRLLVEIRVIVLCVLELCSMSQRLTTLVEKRPQDRLSFGRLAEQPLVADLANVARLEVDLDREAIIELVKLRRIECSPWVIFGKRL